MSEHERAHSNPKCACAECTGWDEAMSRVAEVVRAIWPHMTGHCFDESTATCFGVARDALATIVPGLPYA